MAHQNKPGGDATPQELAAWFDQQDEDENYKMRVRVALSKVNNRLIEHQELTGHNVPLPFPPELPGLTNSNWN